MRTPNLIAGLLVVVVVIPLAAGCGRVSAQTADIPAAPLSTVMGVAGNCPADGGPMRPAPAAPMADVNGDGYVCIMHFRAIDGDTMSVTVDNDAPIPANAWVLPEPYIGM